MKRLFLLLLAGAGLLAPAAAQTPAAGIIHFEVAQRVDLSQARIVMNGQVMKPGSPDFPVDIPDTRNFAMTVSFAGDYAKEARQTSSIVRVVRDGGPDGGAQTTHLDKPFEEETYIDAKARSFANVLTVQNGPNPTRYRANVPFARPEGWQETNQTKKIAGYTCRKATVPFKKETYTVWYTTELPFTYSPVPELLPEKGVVLVLESQQEQYRATKVETKPVMEAEVRPAATAQLVSAEQLKELRDKARADFRQRMMDRFSGN